MQGNVATATKSGRKGLLSKIFGSGDRANAEDQARAELEAALGAAAGVPAAPPPPPPPPPASSPTGSDPGPAMAGSQADASAVAAVAEVEPEAQPRDLMAPGPPTADEQQWISNEEVATFPGMYGRRPAPLMRPHFHELELE